MEREYSSHRSNPNLRPGVVACWPYPHGAARKHGELSETYRRLFRHLYQEENSDHVALSKDERISYDRQLASIQSRLWEMRCRALHLLPARLHDRGQGRVRPPVRTNGHCNRRMDVFCAVSDGKPLRGGLESSVNTLSVPLDPQTLRDRETDEYARRLTESIFGDQRGEGNEAVDESRALFAFVDETYARKLIEDDGTAVAGYRRAIGAMGLLD